MLAPSGRPRHGSSSTRALPRRRRGTHVHARRRARVPHAAGGQPEHQEARGRGRRPALRARCPRRLADGSRTRARRLRPPHGPPARRSRAAGLGAAVDEGRQRDDRGARIGRGVPAARTAPVVPAEVSRHQGQHLPQPPERDSAAGHGPRSGPRLRQGRAGVSRAAVGRRARRRDGVHRGAEPSAGAARGASRSAICTPSSSSCTTCAARRRT